MGEFIRDEETTLDKVFGLAAKKKGGHVSFWLAQNISILGLSLQNLNNGSIILELLLGIIIGFLEITFKAEAVEEANAFTEQISG